jgi:glycosyltransferase involved in cell wall biosynthesis
VRVLFDHPEPFALAHGGFQTQIEQTRLALIEAGVEVEFLQWWNPRQKGEIIHFFGRPRADYIRLAHGQGCKIVIGELLTSTGSRSRRALALQRISTNLFRKIMPATFTVRMAWESYRMADACIALTLWEAHLMQYLFGAPKDRVHVVPNGVEKVFLNAPPAPRGKWLVCTATITERKRVLELAEAAVRAQIPVWIIGKPYADSDPYAQQFIALAKQHPQAVRYEGPIQDRTRLAEVYCAARGFVLLSAFETHSLAAEEAAACGCPLLLSDLPWAHSVFGDMASYCPLGQAVVTASHLRIFYDLAPTLPKPRKPKSWLAVGQQLKEIYQAVVRKDGGA